MTTIMASQTIGGGHPTDSADLERGPNVMDPRYSTASAADGIGSALSSSNSSIMGEDVDPNEEEWGPHHPCFPHVNPHVSLDSPEHVTTRIIRIQRDWMVAGDLAPTFSNLYPEILDPAGLSEQEFRRVVSKINAELVEIFNPNRLRNVVDGVLGVATGWLWDDLGLTSVKSRLNKLEAWIEDWNANIQTMSVGQGETSVPPQLISLRRTGYMTVSDSKDGGSLTKFEIVNTDRRRSWTYKSLTRRLQQRQVRRVRATLQLLCPWSLDPPVPA